MSETDVLYNADCPVCSREIDHYARLSDAQALPLRFDDLNDAEVLRDWGVSADDAAKRLHVRKAGEILRAWGAGRAPCAPRTCTRSACGRPCRTAGRTRSASPCASPPAAPPPCRPT